MTMDFYMDKNINKWEQEFKEIELGDRRLKERLIKVMNIISKSPNKSILLAGGSRNNAKSIYRFLSNNRVSRDNIMEEVRKNTVKNIEQYITQSTPAKDNIIILAVQDTTSISYGYRNKIDGIGYYCDSEMKGINTHSAIAVTNDGLVLGLLHQEYNTRECRSDKSETKDKKKRRIIEDKESFRWLRTMKEARKGITKETTLIHVCDREGDMYELFDLARKEDELFLVRIVQNRTTIDDKKIITSLKQEEVKGTLIINIARNTRENIPARKACMNYTYQQYEIKRPTTRKEGYVSETLKVTGIYVYEKTATKTAKENKEAKENKIEWLLLTNIEIKSDKEAIDIINYYVQRWKIERLHYILKSGCKIEEKQISTYKKLCLVTLLYSLVAMKILHLTYLGRIIPDLPCDLILNEDEWKILYCLANKTKTIPKKPYTTKEALKYIGILAGFKGAPSDDPPGVKLIWIGLEKLRFAIECKGLI